MPERGRFPLSGEEFWTVEWTIKLEARAGWGTTESIEVTHLKRRVVGLTAEEVGLSLEEAK
jgi:hypothetical protein